jgi:hypothetical protein
MAIELFGFEFRKKPQDEELTSFVPTKASTEDGAVEVAGGGSYGTYVDLEGSVRTEAELVSKYRTMALTPECDSAIDEIVNESIAIDAEDLVKLDLDDLKVNDNIKKIIHDEFDNCLRLLEFNQYAYEIYRKWYIDGRLYYHVVIDEKDPLAGIKEVRYIDPRKIRKIREVQKKRVTNNQADGAVISKTVNEYFIFNDKGFNISGKSTTATSGLKIAKDSIVHVVSGITDESGSMVLSYLHKGIKALNQLRTLEDALVIYRLARAPERRIWYIDVGNLPKMKAEQYVREIMVKHKNRLIYDAASGEIRDDRKFMTMLEDYWLPRREGGRGTEVTTLPGGQTLGQMDDVLYFQKKFLNTLNVPVSRLNSDALFSIGRATEITRDEIKFNRFIIRLRARFAHLFYDLLERQLVLKGITTPEDWNDMAPYIKFDFAKDNYFAELKENEIAEGRINLARNYQDFAGKYYSHDYIRRRVLQQTDDDIKENDKQINKEDNSGQARWINPAVLMQQQQQEQAQSDSNMRQQEADAAAQPEDDGERQKAEEVRQAHTFVKQMKARGVDNRTMQEQSKYKRAVQLIAKNPHIEASLSKDA